MIVQMSLTMGYAILNAAGLSFIEARGAARRRMGRHRREGAGLHDSGE